MKKISVIGSGTMGNGIAHCFAQHKFEVNLIDINPENLEKARLKIDQNLERMIQRGKITKSHKQEILAKIKYNTQFDEHVKKSDLVIEAVTESKKIKTTIFRELDSLCEKHTILASNTSSISIKEIGEATKRKDKVIGMHFMNPVPIMKLVEVIKSTDTSKKTIDTIMALSSQLNKTPVLVQDSPGFVANRSLLPMINESIHTLNEKVSGVEEIDTVMILGMSHPMGPLQLADFIGLDVCLSILEVLYDGFKHEKYLPNQLLKQMVSDGELGVKTKKGFYNYKDGLKNKKVSERFIKK